MQLIHALILCVPTVMGIYQDSHHPDRCYDKYHELTWADGVQIPDKFYDVQPPVPYFVEVVSRQTMNIICGKDADACTFPSNKDRQFCITFIQHSYDDGAAQEHILIHERAHCNGWDHKDE